MKKIALYGILLALVCTTLAWCRVSAEEDRDRALLYVSCPPSVMVGGILYLTNGGACPAPEEAQICGEIQSQSAPISGMPTEDGTSNFDSCVGQPYAFVEGELLLRYGGRWNRCVPAEEP